jgi:hypothetical protein
MQQASQQLSLVGSSPEAPRDRRVANDYYPTDWSWQNQGLTNPFQYLIDWR